MKHLTIAVLLLVASLAARAELPPQPDVWRDPDTGTVVMLAKAPRAESAQSIRDQVAGVLDSLFAQPIIPTEFGQTTINGLPGFYMRGVLLVEPEAKGILAFIFFSETETLVGSVTSSEDTEFRHLEAHAKISGTPNPAAAEVLVDIVKRTQADLPELKRVARSKNRAAIEKIQVEVRKDNEAVEAVKSKRGDLSPSETNAAALNQQLHAQKPRKIYGWGAMRVNDNEKTVTFSYEFEGKTVMFVWIVDVTGQTSTNISTDTSRIETLRANKQLNLPSDKRLMAYNPEYDMSSFKNSDFYHGRGTDPLGRPIE